MALIPPELAAERMGLSPATLRSMRYERRGPRFVQLSPRRFRYDEADVQKYIDDRRIDPSARASLETNRHASRS